MILKFQISYFLSKETTDFCGSFYIITLTLYNNLRDNPANMKLLSLFALSAMIFTSETIRVQAHYQGEAVEGTTTTTEGTNPHPHPKFSGKRPHGCGGRPHGKKPENSENSAQNGEETAQHFEEDNATSTTTEGQDGSAKRPHECRRPHGGKNGLRFEKPAQTTEGSTEAAQHFE